MNEEKGSWWKAKDQPNWFFALTIIMLVSGGIMVEGYRNGQLAECQETKSEEEFKCEPGFLELCKTLYEFEKLPACNESCLEGEYCLNGKCVDLPQPRECVKWEDCWKKCGDYEICEDLCTFLEGKVCTCWSDEECAKEAD